MVQQWKIKLIKVTVRTWLPLLNEFKKTWIVGYHKNGYNIFFFFHVSLKYYNKILCLFFFSSLKQRTIETLSGNKIFGGVTYNSRWNAEIMSVFCKFSVWFSFDNQLTFLENNANTFSDWKILRLISSNWLLINDYTLKVTKMKNYILS